MPFWGTHDQLCSSNVKTKLLGTNNSGFVKNSVNCEVYTDNSKLNLVGSTNAKFGGLGNDISTNSCTNVRFQGNNNNATFASETNLKFRGDDNSCVSNSNTNLLISGSQNQCKFGNNTNAELKGSSNLVTANNNTNLEVIGDGNNVTVSDTVNHSLQNTGRNEIRVIPYGIGTSSLFGGLIQRFGTQTGSIKGNGVRNPAKMMIQYATRAFIKNTDYNLGIFAFNMVHTENQITAKFNPADFDRETLTTRAESSTELTVAASKDGAPQTLKFIAPRISHSESGGVTIVEITEIN